MRKTKLLLTAITMSIIMSSTAIAGTWTQDTTGWYYLNDDGTYPANQWLQD